MKRIFIVILQIFTVTQLIASEEPTHIFKIVLIGDAETGKTSLRTRLVDNKFNFKYLSTLGIDFETKSFTIDSQNINLKIWDTSGQEKYRTFAMQYTKTANAIIIVYDITNKTSFENVTKWIEETKKNAPGEAIYFLVGNKTDLEEKREVTTKEGKNLLAEDKIDGFFETSAKDGTSVNDLFETVAKELSKKEEKEEKEEKENLIDKNPINKPSKDNKEDLEKEEDCCKKCPCCQEKTIS